MYTRNDKAHRVRKVERKTPGLNSLGEFVRHESYDIDWPAFLVKFIVLLFVTYASFR